MGLAFPDKITTILRMHRGNSWLSITQIINQLSTNHRQGFFYTDKNGKPTCVSSGAIKNALNDARYWLLVELQSNQSRLSGYGLRTKGRTNSLSQLLRPVLADVLEQKTRQWAGQNKAMDVNMFTNEIQNFPPDSITTTHQIWLLLHNLHPDIFGPGKLTERRLSQFLGLLGPRGAQIFVRPRISLNLFANDPRYLTIRPQ